MSSSSICSQEHFSLSPAASGAISGSDCNSPRGSPTYNPSAAAPPNEAPLDVAGMLRKISDMLANSPQKEAENPYNTSNTDARGEVIPSGPRKPGQGCEEAHQAIMLAETSPNSRSVALRITLLAAGFIIGPIGGCVREISRLSGATIRSRTIYADHLCHRDCREFVIEGASEASVAHAMSIIVDAVNRYKTLCEGQCAGQVVPRSQFVAGVEFYYQPPPRSVVPFAACLKGHSRRTTNVSKEFVKELPAKNNTHQQQHLSTPPPPPRAPPSFKAAVVGSSEEREQQRQTNNRLVILPMDPSRSSPLKRAATSPPASVAGSGDGGAVGAGAATLASEIFSSRPSMVSSKLTRLNTTTDGAFSLFNGSELSNFNSNSSAAPPSANDVLAAAAAVGLPLLSFGNDGCLSSSTNVTTTTTTTNNNNNSYDNKVGDQQVLVPLNLLLASQNLLPNHRYQQQQQQASSAATGTTYSASDILSALTAQLQNILDLKKLQNQQAQQAQHGDAPFYGLYHAENSNTAAIQQKQDIYGNSICTENNSVSMVSPFSTVTTPFNSNTGTGNSTATTNNPSSMASPASVALCGLGGGLGSRTASDVSLFGSGVQGALYHAFSTESDVSNISNLTISQLSGYTGGGNRSSSSSSALRSAFALPSFFHGDSPLSGNTPVAVSRSTSLLSQTDSVLSRESSRRTSTDGGYGGLSSTPSGGFGAFLFPHGSSSLLPVEEQQQQMQQMHQQQQAASLTLAAAMQQWDLLNANNSVSPTTNTTTARGLFESAVTATPAAWDGHRPHLAAGGITVDDSNDALFHMLPKSIWSLE